MKKIWALLAVVFGWLILTGLRMNFVSELAAASKIYFFQESSPYFTASEISKLEIPKSSNLVQIDSAWRAERLFQTSA